MNNDFDFIKDKFENAGQSVPYSLDKSIIKNKIRNNESKVVKMEKRINFKAVAGIALCAALLVGGIVGGQSLTAKTDVVTNKPAVTQSVNKYLSTLSGGVLIAYANDEGVIETKPLELGVKTPLEYSLTAFDIRGMSDKEVQAKLKKLREDNTEISNGYEENYDMMRVGTELKDNVIISKRIVNSFSIKVDPKEVKNVNLKTNTDYWKLCYADWRENVPIEEQFVKGNNLSICGDDFEGIYVAGCEATNRDYLVINLDHDMALCDAIDQNPDIDLSTFDDTLTFTVEYKDGTTAVSVINIGFDANGNLIAEAV